MLYFKQFFQLAGVCSIFALSACDQETSREQGAGFGDNKKQAINTDFDRTSLLTNLTDNVIVPTFVDFYQQSQLLTPAVESYCSAEQSFIDSGTNADLVDTSKADAQAQWRSAMNIWQQAELMQLGPLLEQDGILREKIYSWPNVNPCSVDFDVVYFKNDLVNGQPYDITKRLPSRKGLAALEYLLFNDNAASSCSAGTEPSEWLGYSADEVTIARCKFAEQVATDIENNAKTLLDKWQLSGGYAEQLKQAGQASSDFADAHQAVNRISDALFYLDSVAKDWKLAKPLAIEPFACATPPCAYDHSALESQYAKHSLENLRNNLSAFEKLFTGEGGVGFEAFLEDGAYETTAAEMKEGITQALAQLDSINSSMSSTLTNEPERLEESHQKIKNITDKLKNDFINNLALDLPATSAGDND